MRSVRPCKQRGSGELESTLTSVHPYLRFEVSERLSTWGILGYGTGDLTLTVDAAGDSPRKTWKTDTSMWMAAAGARGVMVSAEDTGGFELAARGDARLVRMSSDAAMGADGAGPLRATEAETSRLRLILEGSHRIELAGGQTLRPSLEIGLRQDGGDAETGTGIEVGGGIAWADPALGLTVTAKARGLVAHEESDYTEWGASGSVKIDPGASGRGLALSLTPAWGADSGNAERLWGLRDARGLAGNDNVEPAGRLDAEAGWGFGAFGGRGLTTPFAGLALSEAGDRTWRSGVRWTLGPDLSFGVEGTLPRGRQRQPGRARDRVQADGAVVNEGHGVRGIAGCRRPSRVRIASRSRCLCGPATALCRNCPAKPLTAASRGRCAGSDAGVYPGNGVTGARDRSP